MTYLLTAAGVIFLSVIVTLLIPEGRLNKTITFVMRMVSIYVLIQPLASLISGTLAQDEYDDSAEIADYAFVSSVYSKWQSGELEVLLEEEFGNEFECEVMVDYSDGGFVISSVIVKIDENSQNFIDDIYAYLEGLGLYNITVYAYSG